MDLLRDPLGRVTIQKVDGAVEAEWSYDQAKKGLLDSESGLNAAGQPSFTRTFKYDDLSRLTESKEAFDGQKYQMLIAYNCRGAVRGMEYPNGEAVQYQYTANGQLRAERDPRAPAQAAPYREILSVSPRGQVRVEHFGNDLYGVYTHFDSTTSTRRWTRSSAGSSWRSSDKAATPPWQCSTTVEHILPLAGARVAQARSSSLRAP